VTFEELMAAFSGLTQLFRLRNRFMFMGVLNAIFSPFIVLYLVMYSFFRYFEVGRSRSVEYDHVADL
jgi:hypothetical protein